MTLRLKHRIDILQAQRAPDGAGGASLSFAPVESQWAGIEHLAAARSGVGARDFSRRIAAIVRIETKAALGGRIRFANDDYEIISIETVGRAERYLRLICEEIIE
jgi:head-tail adaptor